MKNLLFITLLLLVLNGFAQENRSAKMTETKEKEIVLDIRKKFTEIEANYKNNYKKASKDLMDYSTEGGKVDIFYDKDKIRKAETIFYGETGKMQTEYYFWNDKVFFIFERYYKYNSPIYITKDLPDEGFEAFDQSKTKVFEDRYYLFNEKLIRWIDKKKEKVDRNSENFIETQTQVLKDIEFIKSKVF